MREESLMIIRPALKKDFNEIADLIISELGYQNLTHEDIRKRLSVIEKSYNHKTLVACIDGRVVGFIGLCRVVTYETDEYVAILALAVSEKYQRQGTGKALLEAATDYVKKTGVKVMKVSSALHRTNAHLFYEANGFDRVGFTFISNVE